MPDFSLGLGNLYGRFVKDEKQPVRREFSSGSQAFSQRDPSPKPIGGPLVGLGKAAVSTGLDIFGKFYEGGRQISGDVQDISGKTQRAAGDFFGAITGAPGTVIEGATQPVGQLTKDVLPLAAIAAAVLLLR
tara:strand:- start:887 stop:1282 length:396 start_codon:yes stop_codon:yes gene_type:complete